jgi:hypothetical protein
MIYKLGDLIGIAGIASTILGGLTIHSALQASAANQRYLTMFGTVARNIDMSHSEQRAIIQHANALQQTTMYSNTHFMAAAAEMATYLSDYQAIMKAMQVGANYAAGMNGGVQLSAEQFTNYFTQFGRLFNDEYATFGGIGQKGSLFRKNNVKLSAPAK